MSHLMSMILKRIEEREDSICMSTEEMMAEEIKRVNDEGCDEDVIIGSADVKALYPSLDIDFTIEKICEIFYGCDTTFECIDYDELGLYLALNVDQSRISSLGLESVCPKRRSERGRPPTMTGSGTQDIKEKRFAPWVRPNGVPNYREKRRMLTEALSVALKFIMKHHVYTFNNEMRLQQEGGPIGLELTGVIAQVFMVWWDRQLKSKLTCLGVRMYKRYVDDINIVVAVAKPQMSCENGEIVSRHESQSSTGVPVEKRTMLLIQEIGNSIHPSIQIEVDCPSEHQDGKIPILDLKVWIEESNPEQNVSGSHVILHEFYSKDVSTKSVINARSAMPWATKRTVLTQELLRVLLNCSELLPRKVVNNHANDLMRKMQYSGYSKKFRHEVLLSAVEAYNKINDNDKRGIRPMYRPREWKREEREEEKKRKQREWYTKGGYDSVIFIPVTPNSELKNKMQNEVKRQGFKIKIVEQAGTSLKRLLQRSDPLRHTSCDREDCLVCTGGDGKNACDTNNVTYEIKCEKCGDIYVGETARNAYTRGKEHLKLLEGRKEGSVLWRHCREKHEEERQLFNMKVTGSYRNDSMTRQIAEAVRMKNVPPERLMNNKTEWNYFKIPRVVVDKD